jgi:SAM-dependent methyltransferase
VHNSYHPKDHGRGIAEILRWSTAVTCGMNPREARDFLATAVAPAPGIWADLGAGTGTFTRALADILGAGSTIYAVDNDPDAIAALERAVRAQGVRIVPILGDFTRALELPGATPGTLDGILLANALHFVAEPARVLQSLVRWLRPGGSVVLIEYDRRRANRWVPYPLGKARLAELAEQAGLAAPVIGGSMPSRFSGEIYVARMEKMI